MANNVSRDQIDISVEKTKVTIHFKIFASIMCDLIKFIKKNKMKLHSNCNVLLGKK